MKINYGRFEVKGKNSRVFRIDHILIRCRCPTYGMYKLCLPLVFISKYIVVTLTVCQCFMYIWLLHEYSLLVHLAITSMLSIFKLKIVHYVSIVRIGRWLYILYAYVLLEVYTLMRGNAKILHADVRNAIFKCTKIKPHHFKQNVSNFPGVKIS